MEKAIQLQFEPARPMTPVAGLLQRKCACGTHSAQGECTGCAKKKGLLQRHGNGKSESTTAPPIINEVLRSTGRPLDTSARKFFEPRFGQDFSRVRVHTDARADESARSVNALAYTVGNDIVFQSGQYSPQSATGSRLLAHELTHTIQQAGMPQSVVSPFRIGPADDAHEREADAQAARVVDGGSPQVLTRNVTAPGSLQRQPQDPPKEKPKDPPKAATSCMKEASQSTFSRGNDDPAECQYETARTTVKLFWDPCACSKSGVTSIPLKLDYFALMQGKSFSDTAGTMPETQASTIAKRINLEEVGTKAASSTLVHTPDTGKSAIPGDPGDTLAQTLDLATTIPCKGGTASGSVTLGLNRPGTGGAVTRIIAETVKWSLTTSGTSVTKGTLAIDENTPSGRVTTPTIALTGSNKPYPKFPGTPRDPGCSCEKVTGVQTGKSCKPKGGAGFGPGGD
jgi:Domain of unknown function (DUF4157)